MEDEFSDSEQNFCEEELPKSLLMLKPEEPSPDDCCGSGCSLCVYEIYEQEMKIWKRDCNEYLSQKYAAWYKDNMESAICRDSYTKFPLLEILPHTRDCKIYRFRLPKHKSLNLKVGQHLLLRGQVNGTTLVREYTPVSPLNAKGYFDVLVKTYNNGRMSQYIAEWHVGLEMEWRGPYGSFNYCPNTFKTVYMIAAGTGITPMVQVIRSIVENENDETFVNLLFACRTYDDILMKTVLSQYKQFWNFKVTYYLSQESDNCKSHYGEEICYNRINKNTITEKLSAFGKGLILVCGTRSFNSDMERYLQELGVTKEQYFIFK